MGRARLAVSALLLVVMALAVLVLWRTGWVQGGGVDEAVDRAGVWGPVLFVLVYAAVSLLPLPLGLLTVVAGSLFGLLDGVLLVWAGAVLGAVGGWALARSAFLPVVQSVIARNRGAVLAHLSGTGVWPVLLVRLMPVAPFMAVNYVAGATGVPFRPYLLGTVIGILPASALYVQVGAAGLQDPAGLLWALFGIVVLVALGAWLLRRGPRPAPGGG